ncbi:MAG: oligopeptidase B, partial [Gemmatimonadales bacterium]
MPTRIRSFLLALAAFAPGVSFAQQASAPAGNGTTLAPPIAAVRPHRFDEHGNVRVDQYYWLKDRNNPEVIKYLEDENAYTKAVMAHTEPLQERLYEELKGRVLQTDQSVPFRQGSYFYYTRFVEGQNYPIYARKRGSLDASEEILLDVNMLAAGKPTFIIRASDVSPGEDIYAYAVDTTGGRVNTIRFKNLRTGEMLADVIPRTIGGMAWAEDNRTIFYTRPDSVTVRPFQVWRHRLGTPAASDQLVYEDKDETYYVSVFKTKSRAYVMIQSSQTMATEYSYVRADQPDQPFKVLI